MAEVSLFLCAYRTSIYIRDAAQPIATMNIIWEDAYCLVVNKPSGLLTTAARGVDSLEIQMRSFLQKRDGIDEPYVGLPHRIDRPVSGAVLVGKNAKATRLFCAQFQARSIDKTYVAVLEGELDSESGTWIDWMRKRPDEAHADIVLEDDSNAKKAILNFRRLTVSEGLSLVEIRLETGRTHQIRLQAASRGLPIAGDVQYGGKLNFGSQSEDTRQRAIALHARRIAFRHPKSGMRITVSIPVTENWQQFNFDGSLMQQLRDG